MGGYEGWNGMQFFFAALVIVLALPLALCVLDEMWVLWGYWKLRRAVIADDVIHTAPQIAFLVAAHDEENVIGALASTIQRLDWPQSRVALWVVADRCSDQTAAMARARGANVWERHAIDEVTLQPRPVGKGHALNELLDHLQSQGVRNDVEAFVILDADVQLTPGYLKAMYQVAAQGYPVVQGAAWIDASSSSKPEAMAVMAGFAHRAQHVVQQGRFALGLPNLLIGNSLWIHRSVFETLNWRCAWTSPTEEEIKAFLIAHDIPIGYAAQAHAFEEAAGDIDALADQRSRWFRDYAVFWARYGVKLVLQSLAQRRWRRAEAAFAHFWMTSHTLESMLAFGVLLLALLSQNLSLQIMAGVLLLGKCVHALLLAKAAGLRGSEMILLSRRFPFLMLGWAAGVGRWLRAPTRKGWKPTKHRGNQKKP
jgi:glycosyltransferase involved in cell wall biosynthesis